MLGIGMDVDEDGFTTNGVKLSIDVYKRQVEKKALVSLDGAVDYSLQSKIVDGKLYVDQGLIAGCAGGGFENICAAADIIKGKYIGADEFTFSVYPVSYTHLGRKNLFLLARRTGTESGR